MATVEDVAALRLFVSEPDESTYTDQMLNAVLESVDTMDEAAYEIWVQKAASYAELVDISEGGSQRKNGELQKNALIMADLFKTRIDATAAGDGKTRIAKLVRT